jgi:two-component system, cell cycle response regulator
MAGQSCIVTDTSRTRHRILVADDDSVSRRMLEVLLEKCGYEVVSVQDGLEAARILEAEDAPSLAVLDWMMPGLEGTEVCQRVRQHADRPYTYVLLLTARNQKGDLLKGLECGADDYLTKPCDAQELRARLRVGERILDLQRGLIAAQEELRFKATHDALTGIPNRGAVLDALDRECFRQIRRGDALGVILMDLDHFKSINDQYGHLAGDVVLKETGQRIIGCTRPYDTVGRYGGEEFLAVIPGSDRGGTLALAERIRSAIGSHPFLTDAGSLQVTISTGVAVGSGAAPIEPQTLLQLADEALYRAKEKGRNRSELSPTTIEGIQAASLKLR